MKYETVTGEADGLNRMISPATSLSLSDTNAAHLCGSISLFKLFRLFLCLLAIISPLLPLLSPFGVILKDTCVITSWIVLCLESVCARGGYH